MRIITRYILSELLKPFFFGLFAFGGIMLGTALIDLVRTAGQYNMPVLLVLRLFIYQIPGTLALCAPMAMLLATLMGLGRVTGHSETIAMQAGGVSYLRIALPVLVTGLLVSLFTIVINETIVPTAQRRLREERDDAVHYKPKGVINQHFFIDFKDGVKRLVYAEEYFPEEERFHQAVIQEMKENKVIRTIVTEELSWSEEGGHWYFKEGEIFNYQGERVYPLRVAKGYYPSGITKTPEEVGRLALNPEDMNWAELKWYITQGSLPEIKRRELLVKLHQKLAIPFASFFFALLGTPLGLQPQRRTSSAGFGLSLVFIFIYYILMGCGTFLAQSGIISPFIGAWLQNFILGSYGAYHLVKSSNHV